MKKTNTANPLLDLVRKKASRGFQFILPASMQIAKKGKNKGRTSLGFPALDHAHAKLIKRAKGQRGKLEGGQLAEDLAVKMYNSKRLELIEMKKQSLKQIENRANLADACAKEAAREIGKFFGVAESTVREWARGARKRERKKPIEKRIYRRQKAKKTPPRLTD